MDSDFELVAHERHSLPSLRVQASAEFDVTGVGWMIEHGVSSTVTVCNGLNYSCWECEKQALYGLLTLDQ